MACLASIIAMTNIVFLEPILAIRVTDFGMKA